MVKLILSNTNIILENCIKRSSYFYTDLAHHQVIEHVSQQTGKADTNNKLFIGFATALLKTKTNYSSFSRAVISSPINTYSTMAHGH